MRPKLEPIFKLPTRPAEKPEDRAAILFLHGFSDDGPGCENIAEQFQAASKLPHAMWVLPTAAENRDVMTTAWYVPTALPAFLPRPELADDEDEAGMLDALAYVESLLSIIEHDHGVPPERTVLVGFSQGGALALLTALVSRTYAASLEGEEARRGSTCRLGGVVALMSYLPLGAARIKELRVEQGLDDISAWMGSSDDIMMLLPPLLLVRGAEDRLIPRRVWNASLDGIAELARSVGQERLEVREYEGVGHLLNPVVLRDLCAFLEKVLPGPEVEGETEKE